MSPSITHEAEEMMEVIGQEVPDAILPNAHASCAGCMVCKQCGGQDHNDICNITSLKNQIPVPTKAGAKYGRNKKRGPNSSYWKDLIGISIRDMNR